MSSALFLDRDGVINYDYGYVAKPSDFNFVEGIFPLVRCAKKAGWLVIIVTNQAGVARGYFSTESFHDLMSWVLLEFKKESCEVDDYFACFTHPNAKLHELRAFDLRRKPGPGMLFEAAEKHNIDLSRSVFIGDQFSDVLAGLHAGIGSIYFLNEGNKALNLPTNVSVISNFNQVSIEA